MNGFPFGRRFFVAVDCGWLVWGIGGDGLDVRVAKTKTNTTRATGATNRLTRQQEQFLLFYLGGKPGVDGFRPFHGTRSAMAAGYSARSAASQASALLRIPKIAGRVREEFAVRAIPAEAVLAELGEIALAGWRDFVVMPERAESTRGREKPDSEGAERPLRVRMDLGAKLKSLELLGKHYRLFSEQVEVGAADSYIEALRVFGSGGAPDEAAGDGGEG